MKSRSAVVQPARSRALRIALEGWECRELSGPATWPGLPTTARYSSPFSSANLRDVRTRAEAPSDRGEEFPAVMVPSVTNAARSPARDSMEASGRTPSSVETTSGSPLRCLTLIGAISSSKTPFLEARSEEHTSELQSRLHLVCRLLLEKKNKKKKKII